MKKLIILLTLFSFLNSQDKFIINIDKSFNSILYDVTQDYDDTISAVGFANRYKNKPSKKVYYDGFEYLSDTSGNNFGKKSVLLKINKYAEVIYERYARIDDFNEAVAVLKTPQNGFFIGGYTLNGYLFLAKLDSSGNTLFAKKFGTKNYDRMNNLIKLSDGGVLAVGSSTTSRDIYDPLFLTGLGLNDIFLTRFDKNGKMLWSKKYGTIHDDIGVDAAEAYDGSIVVVASTKYEKNHDVTLMRVGENGNIIWLKHFKQKTLITPKKIIRLKDNNFLAALTQQDEMGKKQVRLIKFDLQNNVLIDNAVMTYYDTELNDIKEYADSTIIGVGLTKDRYNTDGYVAVFDDNLEVLCQEHFGGDNYDIFNGVKILRNSKAVAVGQTIPNGSEENLMWVAKLNKDCTLANLPKRKEKSKENISPFETPHYTLKNSDLSKFNTTNEKKSSLSNINLYSILLNIYKDEIKKHQISIKKDLTISFTDSRLLFKQGEYKLTKSQKIFLDKFSKKFIPFLEKYQNYIKEIEIIGHTSSEWNNKNNFTKRYIKNKELSLKRAFSTSSYIFKNQSQKSKKLLAKLLKDSGYSFSKTIKKHNKEDYIHSRRIVIKVVQKSTTQQ